MRLALIYTADAKVWDPAGVDLWETALQPAAHGFTMDVYRLSTRGELPEVDAVDAIVVTGSHHNTCEELPWMARLKTLLQACAAAGKPVVGACFGAQLAAEAFGGAVSKNPCGRFILRAEELRPTPAFAALPAAAGIVAPDCTVLAASGPSHCFRIIESHGYAVSALPVRISSVCRGGV